MAAILPFHNEALQSPAFASIQEHAKYVLDHIWEVIQAFISTFGNTDKIAQIFRDKIQNRIVTPYDAAFEMSFFTDYQISHLRLNISAQSLQVLQTAHDLTELQYKKDVIARLIQNIRNALQIEFQQRTLAITPLITIPWDSPGRINLNNCHQLFTSLPHHFLAHPNNFAHLLPRHRAHIQFIALQFDIESLRNNSQFLERARHIYSQLNNIQKDILRPHMRIPL